MNIRYFRLIIVLITVFATSLCQIGYAQTVSPGGTQTNGSQINSIRTAVPFLLIAPDARSGAMGDAGVAISSDANSIHWNPAKLAYVEHQYGFSATYSPWLQKLIPDINLAYLSGYYKLDERNTLGASLRYFSAGQIELRDANQTDLGVYNPNELAFDVAFARKFGEEFSLGMAARYIRSNLASGQFTAGQQTRAGTAMAVDVSAFYKHPTVIWGTDALVSVGANISNIGTKMSYVEGGDKYFLPTNMKIGGATTFLLDDFSQFTFTLDLNKLLVPTQPLYDANGNIIKGEDPNKSVPAGIFSSFSDAPGGFSEELKEISYSTGLEYMYDKKFALRAGYFYESPTKGDRQYFTLGVGLKYSVVNIDLAYLLASQQKSPMANTLRFSLLFNFGDTK